MKVKTTKITKFVTGEKTYIILLDENNKYWGVEEKLYNSGKEVNGLHGNISDSFQEVLRRCYRDERLSREIPKEVWQNPTELVKYTEIIKDIHEKAIELF